MTFLKIFIAMLPTAALKHKTALLTVPQQFSLLTIRYQILPFKYADNEDLSTERSAIAVDCSS